MRATWAAATVLLALLLAGCAKEEGVVPEQDDQGRYVIRLTANNQFVPDAARIPVGATVLWVVDGGFHDISAEDGSWSSQDGRPLDEQGFPTLLGPGETYERTFTEKGRIVYWCHTHHEYGMKGTLIVG